MPRFASGTPPGCQGVGARGLNPWPAPQELVAGRPGRVLYNSAVGPLNWLQFEEGQAPTLRFGSNGWAHGSQDVQVPEP